VITAKTSIEVTADFKEVVQLQAKQHLYLTNPVLCRRADEVVI
jgi:hypothetical protein